MYYLYALLTAPGVIAHELSHVLFCLSTGVKIQKIKLFQFGQTAGYVTHEEPKKFYQAWFISFGPLLINSMVALLCFSRVTRPFFAPQSIILAWLGAAIALHLIPSVGDAQALLSTLNHQLWHNPLRLTGYPFVAFLYLLNFLKRWHIHFLFVIILFWLGNIYLKK